MALLWGPTHLSYTTYLIMDPQTILIASSIVLLVLFAVWRGYVALKRYSCCGSCGCDLMTKKERKAYEARKKGNA
ncbi:hypothetical protein [Rubritalea tangerina]